MFNFNYYLCVSNRKPHKNEKIVILSFLKSEIPNDSILFFTGQPNKELRNFLDEHDIYQQVRFIGSVNDGDLARWYKGAVCLIFPSLYEGFGLPMVEAMSCGTPVIASNTTALPEIAGGAAILIDPNSTDEIKAAIGLLTKDQKIRHEYISKGLERSKFYSWSSVASRVEHILNSCN